MTNSNNKGGELLGQERRRRWSPEQKPAMTRERPQPGQSVSVVARENGMHANQLFQWRKPYQSGSLSAVSAEKGVVPASQLTDALEQIREIQRMFGKKTIPVKNSSGSRGDCLVENRLRTHSCCRGRPVRLISDSLLWLPPGEGVAALWT